MFVAIGVVILLVMVFGGFAITGGALGPVMHAIPHEMLIIGGAAVGALVTGNSLHGMKAIGASFAKIFKGPRHTKQDHIDAIVLTTKLMRLLRSEGPVALESHVQEPQNSALFAEYPHLLANQPLIALICDTLTLIVVSSGTLEVHAVEEVMDNALKTHFHEMHEPQHALTSLADALPIGSAHGNPVVSLYGDGDSLRRGVLDRVGVPEVENQGVVPDLRPVPHAVHREHPGETLGNAHHHVVDELAVQPVHGPGLPAVVLASDLADVALEVDLHQGLVLL